MTIEYRDSTVTNMDLDECKIAYKQLSLTDGSKFRYSVHALRNNPFKVATVCLGLLCVLLVAGVIGQQFHNKNVEKDYQRNIAALSTDKKGLQENLKTVQKEKRDLDLNFKKLQQRNDFQSKMKDQIETNNALLIQEVNQLKVTQSNLQETNAALKKESDQVKVNTTQLQRDRDSLAAAQNNLQSQYNSAIKRKKELQDSYDSVSKDRDNLQNKFNNVTKQRERLQLSYNDLIKKVEHLQDRHNLSASEKDKLAKSHQNLTIELDSLKTRCDIIKTAQDTLQVSYATVVQEKDELQSRLKGVTAERDQLKIQTKNMNAERDELLGKIDKLNTTIQEKKCKPGWQKFQYSCYYTSTVKKTWNMSRDFCKTMGADLAIINREEEMTFINGLYSSDKEVWIGLTDGGVEGQWKWVDGTPLTLSFWAKDQPNSHQGRNQDCVEFWHRATGNGDWNDESCTVEQNWICEM
ncbi:uncharacterized protein FYW49_008208 [Xenentodon cancila]